MGNGVTTVMLDQLIQAALTGQPYNQQRLGAEAERYSLRLTRAKAPDLPDDLHEEICLEAFVELFKVGASALTKHSGRILFRHAVLAAMRTVRANYAPPGERTRPAKFKSAAARQTVPAKIAAEDVGRIADAYTVEGNTVLEGEFGHIDFDRFSDRQQQVEIQRIEFRVEADAVLKHALPEVARALRLIHLDDHTIEEAAQQVNMSRFVLKRRMDSFCADMQAAA
ncbi:hypothetical protein [Sandaracinobacteroides saxicola]|uniref:Uncharacterized protein n=1 Tax=Sandaracinobacteroides saxicola TaxID=2759707 RepID=A0A7G5IIR7_9SPHN|nr:hypothetical protein [Sandaracinobacteroides saxicola]QMW23259.1 hypothetical protein H3309_01740 [Sandaracinobacteroides saxicola]